MNVSNTVSWMTPPFIDYSSNDTKIALINDLEYVSRRSLTSKPFVKLTIRSN